MPNLRAIGSMLFSIILSSGLIADETMIYSLSQGQMQDSVDEIQLVEFSTFKQPIRKQPSDEACSYFHYLNTCWGQNSCYAKTTCGGISTPLSGLQYDEAESVFDFDPLRIRLKEYDFTEAEIGHLHAVILQGLVAPIEIEFLGSLIDRDAWTDSDIEHVRALLRKGILDSTEMDQLYSLLEDSGFENSEVEMLITQINEGKFSLVVIERIRQALEREAFEPLEIEHFRRHLQGDDLFPASDIAIEEVEIEPGGFYGPGGGFGAGGGYGPGGGMLCGPGYGIGVGTGGGAGVGGAGLVGTGGGSGGSGSTGAADTGETATDTGETVTDVGPGVVIPEPSVYLILGAALLLSVLLKKYRDRIKQKR